MTRHLSVRQAMTVAQTAVGPQVRVGDPGLLASALARPAMSVFGEDAYPSLEREAAALMESLARHVLVDGNKRFAWTATAVFLWINGYDLTYASVDEAEAFVLAVAADHLSLAGIETWIAGGVTPV